MNVFRFRQFGIRQDLSAMRVGTDGVLLGAWAPFFADAAQGPRRILDIGCGTGLLALMLAQRFPQALVEGVEIDGDGATEAAENAAASPFAARVGVHRADFRDFMPSLPYDMLVSNPPFFEHALPAPDLRRDCARNGIWLPAADLLTVSAKISTEEAVLAVIVPFDLRGHWIGESLATPWRLWQERPVAGKWGKQPHRILLAFAKGRLVGEAEQKECLYVFEADGRTRTAAYAALTRDFYLASESE